MTVAPSATAPRQSPRARRRCSRSLPTTRTETRWATPGRRPRRPRRQGTFSSRTMRNPVWTAPAVAADTVFTFQVSHHRRPGRLDLGDAPGHGDAHHGEPAVRSSRRASRCRRRCPWPVRWSRSAITASDPDGDPLTIAWSRPRRRTQGTFGSQPSIGPRPGPPRLWAWTRSTSPSRSPSPTATTRRGATVTVPVKTPSYANDVQPIWTDECVSCHDGDAARRSADPRGRGEPRRAAWTRRWCQLQRRHARRPGRPVGFGLVDKLTGTSCGTRMPEGSQPSVRRRAGEDPVLDSPGRARQLTRARRGRCPAPRQQRAGERLGLLGVARTADGADHERGALHRLGDGLADRSSPPPGTFGGGGLRRRVSTSASPRLTAEAEVHQHQDLAEDARGGCSARPRRSRRGRAPSRAPARRRPGRSRGRSSHRPPGASVAPPSAA